MTPPTEFDQAMSMLMATISRTVSRFYWLKAVANRTRGKHPKVFDRAKSGTQLPVPLRRRSFR
jgi:hypothetical protein